jgi:hypothetical protein
MTNDFSVIPNGVTELPEFETESALIECDCLRMRHHEQLSFSATFRGRLGSWRTPLRMANEEKVTGDIRL